MADTWLIDGVIQFLRSPIWQMPVMGFIDQKCLVFDPEEENKLAYTEIHKEYQQLVEFMLDSFVKDIGIKSEEFVNACKGHGFQSNASIMTLFEQVEAAEDFEVFKRMMIRQNVELELQALRVMQARHGMIPGIMQADKGTTVKSSDAMTDTEDDKILNEILRQSKEEFDALKKQGKENEAGIDAMMDKALASSQEDAQRLQKEKQKEEEILNKVLAESKDDFQTKIEKEQALLDKALNLSISKSSSRSTSSSSGLPPVPQQIKKPSSQPDSKGRTASSTSSSTSSSKPATPAAAPVAAKAVSGAEAAANWLSSAKAEAAADGGRESKASVTSSEASELKKREEYLKKQRDILIDMKRKEREKHFNKETESQSKTPARPKSARAARQATAGEVKADTASSAEQDKKLKMRLALADRLKKEVINEK